MSVSNYISDYPTIGDFFLAQIQWAIVDLIGSTFSPLSNGMHNLLIVCMILAITVYGIRITLNDSKASGREFAVTLIWGLVSLGIIEPDFYLNYVVNVVWGISDGFSSFMLSGEFGNVTLFGAVSKSFSKVFYFVGELFKVWSVSNILPLVAGLVVGAFYGAFYAGMLITVLFVNVILGLLFILGAIIIPLGAFEMWRAVVKSWLQAVLKYSTVSLFVATTALFCNKFIIICISAMSNEAINSDSYLEHTGIMSGAMAGLILTACFGIALLKKTMELTGEITGGVMSDTKGAVSGAVSDTAGAIKGIGAAAKGASALGKLKRSAPTP